MVGFGRVSEFLAARFFERIEEFFGAVDDRLGNSGEFGDLDAIATICSAIDEFSQEYDVGFEFFDGDRGVFNAGEEIGELGEFVVMRGK